MKVLILAGGSATRLGENGEVGPKPMIEIGGHPILWHIMTRYAHYDFTEFIVAVGYKGGVVKRFFQDFHTNQRDVRFHLGSGTVQVFGPTPDEEWVVDVVDTGIRTDTAGRVRRLGALLGDETFMLTFGDAVADIDLRKLLDFHRSQGKLATITVVHPPPRFGELRLDGDAVVEFSEKPIGSGWISGGFMVMEPGALDYITADETPLISETMVLMAKDGQLAAYRHEGFWQGVDTMRDQRMLDALWRDGEPPWMVRK